MGKESDLGSPISLDVLSNEAMEGFYRNRMIDMRLRRMQTRRQLPPGSPGAVLLDRAIRTTRNDINRHTSHREGISNLSAFDVLAGQGIKQSTNH